MKRIAHLTSSHRPFDIRIFHKEAVTLAKAGYEVSLIQVHVSDESSQGVTVRSVSMGRGKLKRMLLSPLCIYRKAVVENADVYHVHDPELIPYAALLRLKGKTVVYDMHENIPRLLLTKHWVPVALRPIASFAFRSLQRVLLARIPIVFAEQSYEKDYPWVKKSEIILNFPIIEELKGGAPRYVTPTLGYFGQVTASHGSLTTLKAIEILNGIGHTVHWHCIGPAHKRHAREVESLARSYELSGIHFHGYLPPKQGWDIIARCHVGLAVLDPIPNFIESFPTKMFEYMALGLPVIVSDFPLYRSIVDDIDCGFCVQPRDPEAIAEKLLWLIENPDEAYEMGKRGCEAVHRKFHWGIETRKLLAFYDEL
ncbi:MAG: glycosyltransferase family 4 protein [Desulfobulbaceae bacterium]|nr:glycosyltransferase family 4 protein [Desulfobulbaceae bacterium]